MEKNQNNEKDIFNIHTDKSMMNLDAQKKLIDYSMKKGLKMAGMIYLFVFIFVMGILAVLGVFGR